jgi:hypothetical protein
MSGIFLGSLAKIARHGFSKSAAFGYAVAVGVSGNLIYEFVIKRDTPPAIPAVAVPQAAQPNGIATPAALLVAPPAAQQAPIAAAPTALTAPAMAAVPPRPAPTNLDAPPSTMAPQTAVSPAGATAAPPAHPALVPAVSSVALPSAKAMPTPPLHPAVLEAPPLPGEKPQAKPDTAVSSGTPAVSTPVVPLGPAIEVTEPPHPPRQTASKPISLLPSAAENDAPSEASDVPAPKPVKPGPGSGGLY